MNTTTRVVGGLAALSVVALVAGCSSGTTDDSSASPGATEAALPPEMEQKFQAVLDDSLTKFNIPGVQAGVWTPDGEWVGVSGKSAPDSDRAPQRDDHTRIGSLTKTFTVAVLLQQVDKGLASLDDPINKYVKGLPNGKTATLRMLASMTSGIPSYTADDQWHEIFDNEHEYVYTPMQLIDFIKDDKPLFPAGTEVHYSNSNTVLLGMVIEQVTGKPFADSLQEGILDPLGMANTSFPATTAAIPSPHLGGITIQGNPEGTVKNATHWNPSWGFTAGAMISTLDDIRIWGEALGTGDGWASPQMQAEREASKTSTAKGSTPDNVYALGFGWRSGWVGHAGSLPGFNTEMQFDTEGKNTIVVMTNTDIPNEERTPSEPARYIYSELRAALLPTG